MPGAADIFGRSLSFPPRVGPDGRMVWSAGEDNIRESIRLILMTDPGERLRRPDFGAGLQPLLFEPNITSRHRLLQDRIQSALARWEPRISVESVQVGADPENREGAIVTLNYRLVATQVRERLSLNLAPPA